MKIKTADDLKWMEHDRQHRANSCREQILEAVKTMRRFLQDIENVTLSPEDGHRDLHWKVRNAHHNFAWGQANAMSSLENAMTYAVEEDRMRIALETAKQEVKS